MRNKFTLTGTDNDGFRHRYSIRKDEYFKKAFLKFMEDLDFNSDEIKWNFYSEDDSGNYKEIKISEFEDCIRYFQNEKYDVDVFFGNKKVILVVRTKSRVPMVKHLEDEAKWIKPITAKKLKEKKKASVSEPFNKESKLFAKSK